MKRFIKPILVVVSLSILALVGCFIWGTTGTRTWRNAQADDFAPDVRQYLLIPRGATAINCWMRYGISGYRYFECKISSNDLASYLTVQGWKLQPIATEPISLFCPFEKTHTKTFTTGQYYRETNLANGGVTIVYLPDSENLFLNVSAR